MKAASLRSVDLDHKAASCGDPEETGGPRVGAGPLVGEAGI